MKRFLKKVRDKLFLNAIRNIMDETFHTYIQSEMDIFKELRDKNDFIGNFKTKKDFEVFCSEHEQSFRHDMVLGMFARTQFSKKVQTYKYHGFCSICNKAVDFICYPNYFGTQIEGLLCPDCRQNVRLRMMYNAVLATYRKGMRVYASEYVTGFFQRLQKVIPDVIGSEFLAPDDERRKTIRHEDVTKLSFEDESLDLYISNDVLEHVFDYKAAFKEAYRVLAPGGKFLFHAPFHCHNEKTEIRAKLDGGGDNIFARTCLSWRPLVAG